MKMMLYQLVKNISCVVWDPQFRYRVDEMLPLIQSVNQTRLFTLSHVISKIFTLNVILPSTLRFSKRSLPFRFLYRKPMSISPSLHAPHMHHYSHWQSVYLPNNTWRTLHVINLPIMKRHPPGSSLLLITSKFCYKHPVLWYNKRLSPHPYPKMSDSTRIYISVYFGLCIFNYRKGWLNFD